MDDIRFLKLAIEKSRESKAAGNFPAGGVVVLDGKVIAEAVSSPYPGLIHADAKAVTKAFEQHGVLSCATLYVSMEPCLMCACVAYWAGIRRIVYAVSKGRVASDYYETPQDTRPLIDGFHQRIERVHMVELEDEVVSTLKEWEKIFLANQQA